MAGESPTARRGHHRSRRGDRRGTRGRGPGQGQGQGQGQAAAQGAAPQPARDTQAPRPNRLDVEQIVRELRARISAERGVELSATQVAELAARRLEAVLAPGQADQTLLVRLRESAGSGTRVPAAPPLPAYTFDESSLDSGGGLVRMLRRLFRPLLRLLFDPDPVVQALAAQARVNAELAARGQRLSVRQAEWNALLYELVTRAVTENARVSIDVETLAARVEALGAKTEFNERRVRDIEGAAHQARPVRNALQAGPGPVAEGAPAGPDAEEGESRRRRRRRRGRRGGEGDTFSGASAPPQAAGTGTGGDDAAPPRAAEYADAPPPQTAPEPTAESAPPPDQAPVPDPGPAAASPDAPAASSPDAPAAAPMPPPGPSSEPVSSADDDAPPSSKWRQVFSPPPSGGDDSQS